MKKYIKPNTHGARYLSVLEENRTTKELNFALEADYFWDDLEVNDILIKEKNSITYKLIKPTSDTLVLVPPICCKTFYLMPFQ